MIFTLFRQSLRLFTRVDTAYAVITELGNEGMNFFETK